MGERAHQQLRMRKPVPERRFKLIETGFHAPFAHDCTILYTFSTFAALPWQPIAGCGTAEPRGLQTGGNYCGFGAACVCVAGFGAALSGASSSASSSQLWPFTA